jgi:hypothetical protein
MSIEDVEINSCMFRQTDRQTTGFIYITNCFSRLWWENMKKRESLGDTGETSSGY